jgi:hypothetical protein
MAIGRTRRSPRRMTTSPRHGLSCSVSVTPGSSESIERLLDQLVATYEERQAARINR